MGVYGDLITMYGIIPISSIVVVSILVSIIPVEPILYLLKCVGLRDLDIQFRLPRRVR